MSSKDKSKILLGKYFRPINSTGGSPNYFVNVFIDPEGEVAKVHFGHSIYDCISDISYATILADNKLIIINKSGQAYLQDHIDILGFSNYYCNGYLFDLGNNDYNISKTTKVIRNNNFLTVTSQATDEHGVEGTLQTVIQVDTYQQISNFFIPLPVENSKMTAFEYISPDTLVASYTVTSYDSIVRDFICFMDRQRNVLSTVEMEPDFKVSDLILDENKNLMLAGHIGLEAHFRIIDHYGNVIWQHQDTNVSTEGDTLATTAFYKLIRSPRNELFVVGSYLKANSSKFVGPIVKLSSINQNTNSISTLSFGMSPSSYQYHDIYYTDQGSLIMLNNYLHSGIYYGFVYNVITNNSSTVSTEDFHTPIPSLSYPNPFSNQLHITLPQEFKAQTTTYQLLDMQGRLINQGPYQPTLNTSILSSGSYILRLSDQEKTYSHTINCSH